LTSVRIVDAADDVERWTRFVESDPHSTFSHQYAWKKIMRDVLGHDSLYLAAIDDDGQWRGVLPLVRVKSVLGHYLISLPFLNDGGPVGERSAQETLVSHAVAEARSSGAGLLELRSRTKAPGQLDPAHRKISVRLPLPSSVEELWKTTLRAKLRSQIRRPMKEGMVFRSGVGELESFYRVFAHNMRDLGTPVLPKAFFEQCASAFGAGMIFGAVYTKDGIPIAGACCLVWRDEIEITWASSLRKYNHLSPNMLLYSRLMEEAIGRGLGTFNFGRSTPGAGTHRFKQQWGGTDVSLPWSSWSKKPGAGVPSADRPLYKLAIATWSHLPLVVANRVGPVLARLLP
jgi:serine/alanine adding enzyme